MEIARQIIWKVVQEKFQDYYFFFNLLSQLFHLHILVSSRCAFFTLRSYLLLIIFSFNPFPPVYLLILWPPNPLKSRVLFIILTGKGKIGFIAVFQQDTSFCGSELGNEGTQCAERRELKDQMKFCSASLVIFTDGPCSYP